METVEDNPLLMMTVHGMLKEYRDLAKKEEARLERVRRDAEAIRVALQSPGSAKAKAVATQKRVAEAKLKARRQRKAECMPSLGQRSFAASNRDVRDKMRGAKMFFPKAASLCVFPHELAHRPKKDVQKWLFGSFAGTKGSRSCGNLHIRLAYVRSTSRKYWFFVDEMACRLHLAFVLCFTIQNAPASDGHVCARL